MTRRLNISHPALRRHSTDRTGQRNFGQVHPAWKEGAKGVLLVVFKVGRSGAEARSAMSHKGAMAGSNRAYDSLFRQCGAIRAEVFADLLDIPGALVCGRLMRGRRVAVLTSTAGAGTLVADSFGMAGFLLPEPDEGTAGALGALLGSGGYDALVTVVGSSALEDWGEEADHDAERAD